MIIFSKQKPAIVFVAKKVAFYQDVYCIFVA